jgi:hypothetical protein
MSEEKKLYDAWCDYYKYVEKSSNNYNIKFEEVEEIFTTLLCENMKIMYMGNSEIILGIEFFKNIFEKQKIITNYQELIDVIKFEFVDSKDSPYLNTHYNIVGFCMKITTHLMWRLCYEFSPRLHSNPENAIFDILNPLEAFQREINVIFKFLENKYGVKII